MSKQVNARHMKGYPSGSDLERRGVDYPHDGEIDVFELRAAGEEDYLDAAEVAGALAVDRRTGIGTWQNPSTVPRGSITEYILGLPEQGQHARTTRG
jgi:hypothetical protein